MLARVRMCMLNELMRSAVSTLMNADVTVILTFNCVGASYGGSSGNYAGVSTNLACGSYRTPFIMGSAHPNANSGLV